MSKRNDYLQHDFPIDKWMEKNKILIMNVDDPEAVCLRTGPYDGPFSKKSINEDAKKENEEALINDLIDDKVAYTKKEKVSGLNDVYEITKYNKNGKVIEIIYSNF